MLSIPGVKPSVLRSFCHYVAIRSSHRFPDDEQICVGGWTNGWTNGRINKVLFFSFIFSSPRRFWAVSEKTESFKLTNIFLIPSTNSLALGHISANMENTLKRHISLILPTLSEIKIRTNLGSFISRVLRRNIL